MVLPVNEERETEITDERIQIEKSKVTENDSLKLNRKNIDTNTTAPQKDGKSEISYDTFQNYLKCYFNDFSNESFEKIVSLPVINIDEINVNLFNLKCNNLTQNEINLDELLVSALLSDEESEIDNNIFTSVNLDHTKIHDDLNYMQNESIDDYEKSNSLDSILFNQNDILGFDIFSNINNQYNEIPDAFFEEYRKFAEKIEMKNLNIEEENPLMDLLKQQIDINNRRREILRSELNKKIKYMAILKTLREIDRKIEKHVFKKIKTKRKKKAEENHDHVYKMIEERNKFYEIFKDEINSAFEILHIKNNIFEDDNVDISGFGLEKQNVFPDYKLK